MFGILGICLGVISEKSGIARGRVPETISWEEFFSERIDNVLMIAFICFGAGYLLSGALRDDSVYVICPKCQTPYNKNAVKKGVCPECLVFLEPVEGFYKRHPELKEKENDR